MPDIVAGLLNMPPNLKLMHDCKNRRKTILAMNSLPSKEYTRQEALPALHFQVYSPMERIKSFTALY